MLAPTPYMEEEIDLAQATNEVFTCRAWVLFRVERGVGKKHKQWRRRSESEEQRIDVRCVVRSRAHTYIIGL
jgi:hypothetical protein